METTTAPVTDEDIDTIIDAVDGPDAGRGGKDAWRDRIRRELEAIAARRGGSAPGPALRHHLEAIRAAADAALAAAGPAEPPAEPTQVSAPTVTSALRAGAAMAESLIADPIRDLMSIYVNCHVELDIHLDGRVGVTATVALLARAARLPGVRPRRLEAHPGDRGTHIWLICDHPATAELRVTAIVVLEPTDADLAPLRALCGAEESAAVPT